MPLISIGYDSEATLSRVYNEVYNGKSTYVGLRYNHVRQLVTNGGITVDFIRSSQNLVDPLIEGLARDLVIKTSEGMELRPIFQDHGTSTQCLI